MSNPIVRREFLQTTVAVTAAGLSMLAVPAAAQESAKKGTAVNQNDLPICDTHQHLWDLTKFNLPWLKGADVQSINRSYLMADYLKLLGSHRVTKTVYMEVNVHQSQQTAEAEYVLDLCNRADNPMVAAIIGGSPQSADFPKYLKPFESNKRIAGVRTVLHDPDRPKGMCLEKTFVENVRLLGKHDKSFDLCMRPEEIGDGAALAKLCPDTRLVVDHCGNMPATSTDKVVHEAWMKGMKAAAALPNTTCKISGIIATAKPGAWKPNDLEPNIRFCLETFGIDRCFFGGDWPVCTLTAPLADWISALKEIVKGESAEWQRKLFHDNAVRIYKLPSK